MSIKVKNISMVEILKPGKITIDIDLHLVGIQFLYFWYNDHCLGSYVPSRDELKDYNTLNELWLGRAMAYVVENESLL